MKQRGGLSGMLACSALSQHDDFCQGYESPICISYKNYVLLFRGYSEDGLIGTISPQREKYVGRGDTTGMLTIDLFAP